MDKINFEAALVIIVALVVGAIIWFYFTYHI